MTLTNFKAHPDIKKRGLCNPLLINGGCGKTRTCDPHDVNVIL